MSTEHEEGWFSAAELAAFGTAAGLPGSERGCKKKAQREGWPSRTVPGKGGRSGELTLYLPPRPLLAAIKELGGASGSVASVCYTLPTDSAVARHMVSEPLPMIVSRPPSDPGAAERRQMLLTVLRTMEHLLLEPVSQETAAAMLEVVDSWRGFAHSAPDLQQRLAAVRSAAWLYASAQSQPK